LGLVFGYETEQKDTVIVGADFVKENKEKLTKKY
jgi:hypothetical protein